MFFLWVLEKKSNTKINKRNIFLANYKATAALLNMKASKPLVGFEVLIDNTIKWLTCLHEIMSRNLIEKLVLNKMAHVLQASVFIPLT